MLRAHKRSVKARWRNAQRMPARKKLWMKARWNSRKATISGAEVISVAAQITDQSMPWSSDGEDLQARRSAAGCRPNW